MAAQGTVSSPHTILAFRFVDPLEIQTQLTGAKNAVPLVSASGEKKARPVAGGGNPGRHRNAATTSPPRA
eukprot:12909996-Prorocentrum_lima.AAC.1